MKLNQVFKSTIITVLITGLISANVFAAGTGDDPTPTTDIPSLKQQQILPQKLQALEAYKNKVQGKYNTLAMGDLKTVGVTPFKQETSYWCGPATTKQVIHYLNGKSESQSYYAKKLGTTSGEKGGTDFTVVDDVLNSLQSKYTYSYSTSDTKESWTYSIMYATDNYRPAVLDLKIRPKDLPNYRTGVKGHILNVSGYDFRSNTPRVRLTDPFDQGNRGETFGNKWYKLDGVYDANQNHFRQAIIW